MGEDETGWPTAFVVDLGSYSLKAGLAAADCFAPPVVEPAVIGRPKGCMVMPTMSSASGTCSVADNFSHRADRSFSVSSTTGVENDNYGHFLVGTDAVRHRGVATLQYLREGSGSTTGYGGSSCNGQNRVPWDWCAVEMLLRRIHRNLKIDAEMHPHLVAEPFGWPAFEREKLAAVLFEALELEHAFLALQSALALYAVGRVNGSVLDCGDTQTVLARVVDGNVIADDSRRLEVGGREVTRELEHLLQQKGVALISSSERELAREMKEQICSILPHVKHQRKAKAWMQSPGYIGEESFKLPDGTSLVLGAERFAAPEVLFSEGQVSGDGCERSGGIVEALESCFGGGAENVGRRTEVLLAGGSACMEGFVERVRNELPKILSGDRAAIPKEVRLLSPPSKVTLAWQGGALLTSVPSFQRMWVFRSEYEECGPAVVHRRCF